MTPPPFYKTYKKTDAFIREGVPKWILTLFWWDLLCNMTLRTFRGSQWKEAPCMSLSSWTRGLTPNITDNIWYKRQRGLLHVLCMCYCMKVSVPGCRWPLKSDQGYIESTQYDTHRVSNKTANLDKLFTHANMHAIQNLLDQRSQCTSNQTQSILGHPGTIDASPADV